MNNNQVSTKAVLNATGKNWEEWFALLDKENASTCSHKEIVAILKTTRDLNDWWQQMVTVEYEKARGLRKQHEMVDGFQISKSKTILQPIGAVYTAWIDEGQRKKWMDTPQFTIRKANKEKSLRITWTDGSSHLDVHLTPKSERTQVSINHKKLPDEQSAKLMKAFWQKQLNQLSEFLNL